MARAGNPVILDGDAYARGLAQAHGSEAEKTAVRSAIELRLSQVKDVLELPVSRRYLRDVHDYTRASAPEALREMGGVADGFGLAAERLFAYLHAAILTDIAISGSAAPSADGCSAWAAIGPGGAAWIGKNRDFRGEHTAIQRVFRHADPAWGGRRLLCVGSLGAPGAYSSGINSDGLALADTQIATRDHGIGLCRYFLMTEILACNADVPAAIGFIRALRHGGGGALILADAAGNRAAVELGHSAVAVEIPPDGRAVRRTNHFISPELTAANLPQPGEPMASSSRARLTTLSDALERAPKGGMTAWAKRTMASHDTPARTGLCRHGEDGDAATISTSLFATRDPALYFCEGNPCKGNWSRFGF